MPRAIRSSTVKCVAAATAFRAAGLRRAGFTASELRALKEAYRLLLRAGLPLDEALRQLAELNDANVNEMIEFVRGSKRGFCHEPSRGRISV